MTNLPRGSARLSAIRVISSLTEWPTGLAALFQGDIVDALLLISSEAEELQTHSLKKDQIESSKYRNSHHSKRIASLNTLPFGKILKRSWKSETNEPLLPIVHNRPKHVERATTTGSSVLPPTERYRRNHSDGSDSSSVSHKSSYSNKSITSLISGNNYWVHGYLNRTTSDAVSDIHTEYSAEEVTFNFALDETVTVCFALANFCQANEVYAKRLLLNGLLNIMLVLSNSHNTEIGRQALRCISAMCPLLSLTSVQSDKALSSTKQKKIYKETLDALTHALGSRNSLIQREAVNGIAGLSPNSYLHEDILSGPFRVIIGLILDRNYCDRETRAAAEEVNSIFYIKHIDDNLFFSDSL
jgi:hypothetical protein